MPLIYFMSWRSCRRFGQAFSETAAWVVGYLIATGFLLTLHFGGVGMITATPDDPASVVAIIGGFIGMGVSRYLWKRRGGHLEPVNNPLANNRWFRAAKAIVVPDKSRSKSKTVPRQQSTVKRSAPPRSSTSNIPRKRTTPATTGQTNKSPAQRWGRVLGAMLTPSDSQRRPPQ